MDITQELLEKYWNGECTEEEKHAVDSWLASTESEPNLVPDSISKTAQHRVWIRLSERIFGSVEKIRQMPRSIPFGFLRYVAACVLLMIGFGVGILTYTSNLLPIDGSVVAEKIVLSIPEQEKTMLVDQDCEVQFSGVLSLNNPTTTSKEIVCNGKVYTLAAGERYLIDSRFPNLQSPSMRVMREFIINDFVKTDYYASSTFSVGICEPQQI